MRVLLTLAILVGALWAFDAYEYGGYYWNSVSYQLRHDADEFSRTVSNVLSGHGH